MGIGIKMAVVACVAGLAHGGAWAGGGPLGIDSRLNYDDHGIWKRSNQKRLQTLLIGGEIVAALWEGDDTRLGRTFWQSIDSSVIGGVSSEVLKRTFRRERPRQTDDPNQWFKSGGRSFPSGDVTTVAAVITPFVLEYGHDHPAIYALELLPLYDGIARMKVRGHWQTDVLAGWALGTATGYYAHSRQQSFTVALLPRGVSVGWRKQF
ncbi:MAG: phosphatase PAP2 family protein [Pseudomonadota bacterium]